MNKELTIVVPVLNEEKNIELLTKKIIKVLKNYKFEIIFVDDSSKDSSKKILKRLQSKYIFFRPIFRKKKPDLTKSCFEGIEKAMYQNILIMDGDLQHNPKYINKMYKKYTYQNLDLVVGARKLFQPNNQGLSEIRRIASIILIYFFSIFNIKTKDPMSGFFIFNKKLYVENKKRFFGKGFKILADFLISSKKAPKTMDIYINFNRRYKNQSKMNNKIFLILMQFYFSSVIKKLFF